MSFDYVHKTTGEVVRSEDFDHLERDEMLYQRRARREGPACTCVQASDAGHPPECPRADWARGNRPTITIIGNAEQMRQAAAYLESQERGAS